MKKHIESALWILLVIITLSYCVFLNRTQPCKDKGANLNAATSKVDTVAGPNYIKDWFWRRTYTRGNFK